MKPTENLKYEHQAVKLMLKIMSKISESIKSKEVFYTKDVEEIVDFLVVYFDKGHRIKEEKFFYPAFKFDDIQMKNDCIVLLNEHLLGKSYLNEIICCVENCKIGSTFSCEKIADCMINYVTLIQNHIQKEENIYFPYADQVLSEDNQIELSKQFQTIDNKIIGTEVQKGFDELLKEMEYKYLKE